MEPKCKAALALMLNGFPQSPNTDSDALMMALEIALEGVSSEAIIKTCRKFMRGQVKEHDIRFAPSIPQIVKAAEYEASLIEAREQSAMVPKLPAPVHEANTPEQMERMKIKMQALTDRMALKISDDEFELITGVSWQHEQK